MINHPVWLRPPTIAEGMSLSQYREINWSDEMRISGLGAWLPKPNQYYMNYSSYNFFGIDRATYFKLNCNTTLTIELTEKALKKALSEINLDV